MNTLEAVHTIRAIRKLLGIDDLAHIIKHYGEALMTKAQDAQQALIDLQTSVTNLATASVNTQNELGTLVTELGQLKNQDPDGPTLDDIISRAQNIKATVDAQTEALNTATTNAQAADSGTPAPSA